MQNKGISESNYSNKCASITTRYENGKKITYNRELKIKNEWINSTYKIGNIEHIFSASTHFSNVIRILYFVLLCISDFIGIHIYESHWMSIEFNDDAKCFWYRIEEIWFSLEQRDMKLLNVTIHFLAVLKLRTYFWNSFWFSTQLKSNDPHTKWYFYSYECWFIF